MDGKSPFLSISRNRNDNPSKILQAFGDRSIFAMTQEVYLPMSDGICRSIPCQTDDFEDHYPINGVEIYKTPLGQPLLITNPKHNNECPIIPRPAATPLREYRLWLSKFYIDGQKLQTSLKRLRGELYDHFRPLIGLAEDSLSYDMSNYGLSLARNRHAVHRKLFRQILNSEVDISLCLRETFRFARETSLRDASRAQYLWPLRHALSTIKTINRVLYQSIETLDKIMIRVKDIIRWEQDHGRRAEFAMIAKGSPLFMDKFHAEGWYNKIQTLWEHYNDEWHAEKHGKPTTAAVPSEKPIVRGLSRRLSTDTLRSLSVAERERRPYTQSNLARQPSSGSLGKSASRQKNSSTSDAGLRRASVADQRTSSPSLRRTPSMTSCRTPSIRSTSLRRSN